MEHPLVSSCSPITFDRYVSMDRGPVLSRTRNLVTEGSPPDTEWTLERCISHSNERYEVSVLNPCGSEHLSDAEEAILRGVFDRGPDRRIPPFIDRPTSISYADAKLASAATIEQLVQSGAARVHDDCSEQALERIRQGFLASSRAPRWLKAYGEANF